MSKLKHPGKALGDEKVQLYSLKNLFSQPSMLIAELESHMSIIFKKSSPWKIKEIKKIKKDKKDQKVKFIIQLSIKWL